MIRRSFRFGIRLGLLGGIALALFKLVQGRRSSSDLGRPSADWAPPPPIPPQAPPEPELVQPVILEEVVAKKAAEGPAPEVSAGPGESVVEKAAPAKKAAAKKAAPAKKAAKKQP